MATASTPVRNFWPLDHPSTALSPFDHSFFSRGFQSLPSHSLTPHSSLSLPFPGLLLRLLDKPPSPTPLFLSLPLPMAASRSRVRGSCMNFLRSLSASVRNATSKAKRRMVMRTTWASCLSSRSSSTARPRRSPLPMKASGEDDERYTPDAIKRHVNFGPRC
jgi:hypothetical protein